MESHVNPAPLESYGYAMLVVDSVFLLAHHESYGNMWPRNMGIIEEESKHSPKEDKLEENREDLVSKFCAGCKSFDHKIYDCPKDPNMKTLVNIDEEKQRLESLLKNRRKGVNAANNLQERMIEVIGNRIGANEFFKDSDDEDEVEEIEGVHFRDLMDIKEELDLEEKSKWFQSGVLVSEKVEKIEKQMTIKPKLPLIGITQIEDSTKILQ